MTLNSPFRVLALSLFAIAFAGPSSAAERCVDPDDVPSCFPTINAAILGANPGDTIEIEEGTYEENVLVGKQLKLRGEHGVVIRAPDGAPGILVTVAGVELEALKVRGPADNHGIRIETGAADVTIDDVSVLDVESESCIETNADRTTVKHSRVEACGGPCISGSGDDLSVRDTKIEACSGEGVLVHGDRAKIEESRIARTGHSCVALFGDEATIYDSQATNCYLCGFCIIGDGGTIDRSRANATLEDGICGWGYGAKFTRNRTEDTLLSGIFWDGRAHIEKNEIKGAGLHGMDLWGNGFKVRYNEVEDAGGDPSTDCYSIGASDSWVRSNEAEDCPDDGFDIGGDRNYIENNDTESIIDNGFEVTGMENTLRVNTATDSGSFDLCDEGSGTVLISNSFDSEAPPPLCAD